MILIFTYSLAQGTEIGKMDIDSIWWSIESLSHFRISKLYCVSILYFWDLDLFSFFLMSSLFPVIFFFLSCVHIFLSVNSETFAACLKASNLPLFQCQQVYFLFCKPNLLPYNMTSDGGGLHFQKWVSWYLGLSAVFSPLPERYKFGSNLGALTHQAGGDQVCPRGDWLAPWGRGWKKFLRLFYCHVKHAPI